jgi:hypothetical protein
VAPVSWLVQRDVDGGRAKLNYSEWGSPSREAGKSAATVRDGSMPPWQYLPAHPAARLSLAEKDELIRGLAATFGDKP